MSPQPWFVLAGLLFLLALIASLALVLVVIWVVLRGAALAATLDNSTDVEQDPAAVLAELLADLAAHHHRQQAGWEQPPVIDLTPPPGSGDRPGGRR